MTNDDFTPDSDPLFWQAMRYVAGEMSDGERADFETCLGDDVAACEAVAEALRLSAGLNALRETMPQPAQPLLARPAKRRLWPVALCAGLLAMTGLAFIWRPSSNNTETLASAELVNRWRLDGPFAAIELADADEFGDEDAEIVDESLSAPGWMVSAVRLTAIEDDGLLP